MIAYILITNIFCDCAGLLPGSEANDQHILDEALAILNGNSVSNFETLYYYIITTHL